MFKYMILLFGFGVCSQLIGVSAHAELVMNGDFSVSVPSNGTGGGWTSSTIDSNGGYRTVDGNPGGNFILNHNGGISSDPELHQTISGLVIGQQYLLSWDYRRHALGTQQTTDSFGVFLDSMTAANALFIGENLTTTYETETLILTATSTSHTLYFVAELDSRLNGIHRTDVSYRLDNVSLRSVPEPSSLGCMAFAFLGFGFRRRHKTVTEIHDS